MQVFSDLVLKLTVHRVLCESGSQVLSDVPGDGRIWGKGGERGGREGRGRRGRGEEREGRGGGGERGREVEGRRGEEGEGRGGGGERSRGRGRGREVEGEKGGVVVNRARSLATHSTTHFMLANASACKLPCLTEMNSRKRNAHVVLRYTLHKVRSSTKGLW